MTAVADEAGFVLPASFAQQRLWFLDRIEPDAAVYNVPLATRLRGPLDADALARALQELAARHESLRTVFTLVDDVPHQLILAELGLELDRVDLGDDAGAAALADEEARRPFDLSTGPLVRATLVSLGAEDHLFLLTAHHIIVDAWSMGILMRELGALYGGFAGGAPNELPELQIQYGDYAAWQHEWLAGGGLDDQLSYWRARLAGAPALLELPTDRPRPARQSFRGATVRRTLPLPLLERVRTLGEREGATVFMTLLAAFAALLSRYSAQDDVVVASPVANRNRVELEHVVGFLVNTLALRVDLEGDPSFADLLARVRETVLGALSNQDLPFEKLVEELNPERDLSHAPVAQVLFVAQNAVDGPTPFPGLSAERLQTERGTAKFDLSFFATETAGGLRISLEYCSDLFAQDTARRMLDHFEVLLEAAVDDPSRPLGTLPLLGAAERERILDSWSGTPPQPSALRPAHELFLDRARATPDAVAVVAGSASLSYAELDDRSRRLAGRLRSLGVGPDVVVAICAERTPQMVVAVLATLRAGGAYAPIDPAYPPERIAFMLEDTRAPVLLTEGHLVGTLPAHGAHTLALDAAGDVDAPPSDGQPEARSALTDLAYVIHTSGSSGRPKGVAMPHGPLAGLLDWQLAAWRPRAAARTLQFASLSFDVAFQELLSTLASRGTLVLVDEPTRRDPQALLALLAEQRVERIFMPFVGLQTLCEAAEQLESHLPSLRQVITAGEQLKSTGAIRDFFARHPRCSLVNQYGPTESHVVTAHELGADPARWPELPPIGRPVACARIYLLDRRGQPVPVGVPGELHIGGASLARGYLGREDLTRERFVADPFTDDAAARMYRTGDLARWRLDGTIDYLGRSDQQVKVRGFRIEPGEVEGALREHPGVREALVIARGEGDERRLVAYVICERPAPDPSELGAHCSRTLPEYMVPGAFVALDAFPLSPNGKVDRSGLPAPDDAALRRAGHVAPRTPLERALSGVWAELLAIDRVGVEDNFFALGGHSLLAIRVVSRIRGQLGAELPLSALFEHPTVASLAAAVEEATRERPAAPALDPIPAVARTPGSVPGRDDPVCVLPASYAEQRLWFLDRLEPGNPAYNVASALRLRGPLDVSALERALDALARRHEPLRTTFALIDGEPRQLIAEPSTFELPFDDLRGTPDATGRALELLRADAAAGFDLASGPLLRVRLIRTGDDDHLLLIAMHHIVVDGWSLGVFGRELATCYRAFRDGTPPALPELEIQYADYAVWQQAWIADGGLDRQLGYWRDQLDGIPALLELPTDRPRPARQSFRGAVVRRALDARTLERVRRLGEAEGTTLFMTLLAAFAALLSRYGGQDDIVVASPVANRSRVELEGLIGFFVNTLPLRTRLDDDPSFRALLGRVRETSLDAFANQDVPFEKLVADLNPERQLSFPPLAQVSFALNEVDAPLGLPGVEATRVSGERQTTKFDLGLYAAEGPEGVRLSIEYAVDLFDEATVERMLAHYVNLLRAALEAPGAPISTLRLLDDAERRAALEASEARSADHPVACMHEQFEAWARRAPQAAAASFDGATISYGELNRRANRLAHRLRAHEVGPGTLVALLLEPSFETLVAILGVLKAGAAYVPLDPRYPRDRLAFMLEDTRSPIVVTAEPFLDRLPTWDGTTLCLDRPGDATSDEDPVPLARPDDLAYVIYTSGSTGQPKGVLVEHRQVARLFSATNDWFAPGPGDTWLLAHSYAFDFSVWEMWGALAHGGRIAIPRRSTTRAPAELASLIADQGVTVLNATPSLFLALQEELLGITPRLALRLVIFGGEALHPPSLRPWFDRFGDRGPALVNMYGITETTVHVTYRPLSASDCEVAASPIGVPIPDLGVYLLDDALEPVPPGIAGELYVGGAGVARGYLNRPELTAERFVENPFGAGRLYRTGDVARRLANGELDFRGRSDQQVKIRGYRIELGEVRAAIVEHPAASEAVVLARPAAEGDLRLVAYVVAEAGADELRAFVAERLPSHMVPAAWIALDALPLTRNGKLDSAALPEPEYSRAASAERFAPPSTPTERLLAPIWREVLGVERIGVNDDFFELGGHSMLAVRLFAEIERRCGVRLPISALFETTTIAGVARLIDRDREQAIDWSRLVLLHEGDGGTPLFLVSWADGEVLPYRPLVEQLDGVPSVYGLLGPGVDHRTTPLGSVAALADYYVRQVRDVQPHGPYRLGGYCFSGMVAYEMARRLSATGESVELLALIDSYPFKRVVRPGRIEVERARFQEFKHEGVRGKLAWLARRVVRLRNRGRDFIYLLAGPALFERLARRNLEGRLPRRPWNLVLVASNLARRRYVPEPLGVRIDFFRAQTSAHSRPTPWDALAGRGVTLHPVVASEIDHENMMREPHVQALASMLSSVLRDAAPEQDDPMRERTG
jgi:amino acid adenylation domain-containing protein